MPHAADTRGRHTRQTHALYAHQLFLNACERGFNLLRSHATVVHFVQKKTRKIWWVVLPWNPAGRRRSCSTQNDPQTRLCASRALAGHCGCRPGWNTPASLSARNRLWHCQLNIGRQWLREIHFHTVVLSGFRTALMMSHQKRHLHIHDACLSVYFAGRPQMDGTSVSFVYAVFLEWLHWLLLKHALLTSFSATILRNCIRSAGMWYHASSINRAYCIVYKSRHDALHGNSVYWTGKKLKSCRSMKKQIYHSGYTELENVSKVKTQLNTTEWRMEF